MGDVGKRQVWSRALRGIEPEPPLNSIRRAGHHWLDVRDYDGHSFGLIALQWNPSAKRWSRSGEVATGRYVSTEGYVYVAECPLPELQPL